MNEPALAAREQKHMGIIHAIERLGQVADNATRIKEKIADDATPKNEVTTAAEHPSLLQTLNGSGNNIAELAERINQTVNEIEELIF